MIFKLVIFSSNHRLQIRFSCFVLYMCVFIFLTPRLKLYHPCSWRNSMRLISTCKTTNKIQSRFKPYQNVFNKDKNLPFRMQRNRWTKPVKLWHGLHLQSWSPDQHTTFHLDWLLPSLSFLPEDSWSASMTVGMTFLRFYFLVSAVAITIPPAQADGKQCKLPPTSLN
jgi:hypothetical protein